MRNLFCYYEACKAGEAIGELIGTLLVLAALAIALLFVGYILLIILIIFGIVALLTGMITATISFIRVLTQEVKYLKQIRLQSCNPSQSIFLALSDCDSLVRVLGNIFTCQQNLFNNVLRNKKILRFFLLFLVQAFGYTTLIAISALYFIFFGSVLLIRMLINYSKSIKAKKKPYDRDPSNRG